LGFQKKVRLTQILERGAIRRKRKERTEKTKKGKNVQMREVDGRKNKYSKKNRGK